jgi:hypothetical protein
MSDVSKGGPVKEDNLTVDAIRAMAAEIGMTRLTDEHLHQLMRATNAAHARRNLLKVDTLGPADEPAHVYRLKREER